jgi:hypothetical protein
MSRTSGGVTVTNLFSGVYSLVVTLIERVSAMSVRALHCSTLTNNMLFL